MHLHFIDRQTLTGAKITQIHQVNKSGANFTHCLHYFITDRGFTFRMPAPGQPWHAVTIPREAFELPDYFGRAHPFPVLGRLVGHIIPSRLKRKRNDTLHQIKQRAIAGIYFAPVDPALGFYLPEATIYLDDGSILTESTCSIHGLGGAGLNFRQRPHGGMPVEMMVDFFSIRLFDD